MIFPGEDCILYFNILQGRFFFSQLSFIFGIFLYLNTALFCNIENRIFPDMGPVIIPLHTKLKWSRFALRPLSVLLISFTMKKTTLFLKDKDQIFGAQFYHDQLLQIKLKFDSCLINVLQCYVSWTNAIIFPHLAHHA